MINLTKEDLNKITEDNLLNHLIILFCKII